LARVSCPYRKLKARPEEGKQAFITRTVLEEDGRVSEYSISFYKDRGDWFDEIRYDSHERRPRKVLAPHFHMKLRSSFKGAPAAGLEEIKSMIDNYLETIQRTIET
jgi:hypothetical protein